jgi:large subunit ribosomal protein L15
MELNKLPKLVKRSAKRVGRGIGSGKGGHTSGRGTKGQKARGKVPVQFEGTKMKKSLIKRMPLLRGKGRFKAWKENSAVVLLRDLEAWSEKKPVNVENLVKEGWVDGSVTKVKVLGNTKLSHGLTIEVAISKKAAEIVEKAGGKITK